MLPADYTEASSMDTIWAIWLAGICALALYMLGLAYTLWRRHHDGRIPVALIIGAGILVAGSVWMAYASAGLPPSWPKLAISLPALIFGIGLHLCARWLRDRVAEQRDLGERHPLLGAVVGASGGLSFVVMTWSLLYVFSP
jgi:hypothetical protein